jgi:hypothetical protein
VACLDRAVDFIVLLTIRLLFSPPSSHPQRRLLDVGLAHRHPLLCSRGRQRRTSLPSCAGFPGGRHRVPPRRRRRPPQTKLSGKLSSLPASSQWESLSGASLMQPDLWSPSHHVHQRQEPHSRSRSRTHGREEGRRASEVAKKRRRMKHDC